MLAILGAPVSKRGYAVIFRSAVIAAVALALGSCATYDAAYSQGYHDGSQTAGGNHAASADASGDYYDGASEGVAYDYDRAYFGGACLDYGVGFEPPGPFGCGFAYAPWFFGPWFAYGWHGPWRHHHGTAFLDEGFDHRGRRFEGHHGMRMQPHNSHR
jgi:hypothetical protein